MREMILVDPIKDMTAILKNALNAEVEVIDNKFVMKKLREITVTSGDSSFSFKVDCDITFEGIHQQGATHNKAEILLMPEELPIFSSALISHRLSLPSNYSQRLVIEPNVFCLYMESRELPEEFAERLAAALKAIN